MGQEEVRISKINRPLAWERKTFQQKMNDIPQEGKP